MRYQGSMTSGTFDETVSWVVFEEALAVDDPDLAPFSGRAAADVRPLQDRNRRIVVRCRPPSI